MLFKVLSSTPEYNEYIENFYESLGGKKMATKELTPQFLKMSYVVGLFDNTHSMIGGYILSSSDEPRLLDFVPVGERGNITLPDGSLWTEACEIVCVWKKPEVSSLFMSLVFWPKALAGFFLHKKKYLLGHNQSKKLDKVYTTAGPKTIYLGTSEYGLPSRLFVYNKWGVLAAILAMIFIISPQRFLKKYIREWRNIRVNAES